MKPIKYTAIALMALIILTFWYFHQDDDSAATATAKASEASINLNNPARYAFISDKNAPKLAVFDTQTKTVLAPVDLKTPAQLIDISKDGGYLVYAKRGESAFYQLDLNTQQQQRFATENPIETIVAHSSGRWLAYSDSAGVNLINRENNHETHIATQGELSLLYHPTAEQLFIAELDRGRLQRVNLADGNVQTLFDLGSAMSPISVMPNGMALFFVAEGKLQRYSLLDEALIALDIATAPLRPYMTSDSRLILALSDTTPTELLAINAYTYKLKNRYPLPDWQLSDAHHDFMITGWLEQVAVLADDNALYSLTLDKTDSLKQQSSDSKIGDMLIQSDSKTLLFTQKNSDKLGVFDLQKQAIIGDFSLNISAPEQVIMGETNTLCH